MAGETLTEAQRAPACKDCRYFFEPGHECRRHPPTVEQEPRFGIPNAMFPSVEPTTWCGEFAPAGRLALKED